MTEPPTRVVDIERARVGRGPDGAVTIDDPGSPWLVRLSVLTVNHRPVIRALRIELRHPDSEPIRASRLAQLPLAAMLSAALASEHPNEAYYRLLARPKPPRQRSWPDDHYDRVLVVHDWAHATGRPGGGAGAVADMWGVARNPTANRWLAEARRRRVTAGRRADGYAT